LATALLDAATRLRAMDAAMEVDFVVVGSFVFVAMYVSLSAEFVFYHIDLDFCIPNVAPFFERSYC